MGTSRRLAAVAGVTLLATPAFIVFRYIQRVGRNAAIVGALKSAAEGLASYEAAHGKFPFASSRGVDWRITLRRASGSEWWKDNAENLNCIGGVFDEKHDWLCSSPAAQESDAAMLVFWPDCLRHFAANDLVVSNDSYYVVAPDGTRKNVSLEGCSLCRWSGGVEMVPAVGSGRRGVQFFWGNTAECDIGISEGPGDGQGPRERQGNSAR